MSWTDDLPDRQVRARAGLDLSPPPGLVSGPGPLLPEHASIVCLGGRFAVALGEVLETRGYRRIRTDAPHPALPPIEPEADDYAASGTGTGPIGSIAALDQLVRRCLGRFAPAQDRWHQGELVIDPFRPGLRYPARSDREFDVLTERYLTGLRSALRRAQAVVVALDTTEVCEAVADGAVLPDLPETLDPEHYRLRSLSLDDVSNELSSFLGMLGSINRDLRVLLMVSPEPARATGERRHILTADMRSKAILQVAIQRVLPAPRVAYVPAFELAWAMGVAPDAALTNAPFLSALAEAVISSTVEEEQAVPEPVEAEAAEPPVAEPELDLGEADDAPPTSGRGWRRRAEAASKTKPVAVDTETAARTKRKQARVAAKTTEKPAPAKVRAVPVDESGFKEPKRKRGSAAAPSAGRAAKVAKRTARRAQSKTEE